MSMSAATSQYTIILTNFKPQIVKITRQVHVHAILQPIFCLLSISMSKYAQKMSLGSATSTVWQCKAVTCIFATTHLVLRVLNLTHLSSS